ncbi:hypothetical protein VP1G_09458 [Cytospora mali]|uniref:Uncharacterized protein n=1 Tax=Cytospora mali TaxID=578113 RepID=A0A194VEB3_CYTMA|nr:hypothetical protein VP1G_09458 [Valsa mali var. pyri (nom. inval.)]
MNMGAAVSAVQTRVDHFHILGHQLPLCLCQGKSHGGGDGRQEPFDGILNAPTGRQTRTYWDLGQAWKSVCFARLRRGDWLVREWDRTLQEGIRHAWQPLSDFNYVMQIYYHLTGARNYRVFPELTVRYLSWMMPEQMKIHRDWYLSLEEGSQSSVVVRLRDNSSSGHSRVTDGLRITGSKYPLTTCQLFKVARVCNDAEWAVKLLLEGLNEFRYCRAAYLWAGERRRNDLRPYLAQKCTQARNECLDMSKCLVARLKVSPILLCEFMGLDPAKVPSCHYPERSNMSSDMSGAVVTQEGRVPREQGERDLSRSFGFQKFSLQIGHIALEINYHAPFLPRGAIKSVSRRMLARSERLADEARKAGEWRTEAKMRCLRKKIRCVSERTEQNSFPETIRLLDSVTRPAVLEPQGGAGVKAHGELGGLPLETLLDKLDSLLVPEKRPASQLPRRRE